MLSSSMNGSPNTSATNSHSNNLDILFQAVALRESEKCKQNIHETVSENLTPNSTAANDLSYTSPRNTLADTFFLPYPDHNYCSRPLPSSNIKLQGVPTILGIKPKDHNYGATIPTSNTCNRGNIRVSNGYQVQDDDTDDALETAELRTQFDDCVNNSKLDVPITNGNIIREENCTDSSDYGDDITRCICKLQHDDGFMIQCDKCRVWQHCRCLNIYPNNVPDNYLCEACEPRETNSMFAKKQQNSYMKSRPDFFKSSRGRGSGPSCGRGRPSGRGNKPTNSRILSRTHSSTFGMSNSKIKRVKSRHKSENLQNNNSTYQQHHHSSITNIRDSKLNNFGHTNTNNSMNNSKMISRMCEVIEIMPGKKHVESTEDIRIGTTILEYIGTVRSCSDTELSDLMRDSLFLSRLVIYSNETLDGSIVIFANLSEDCDNIARYVRRSCTPNSVLKHVLNKDDHLQIFIVATQNITKGLEICIPFDYDYKSATFYTHCACSRYNCPVENYMRRKNSKEFAENSTDTDNNLNLDDNLKLSKNVNNTAPNTSTKTIKRRRESEAKKKLVIENETEENMQSNKIINRRRRRKSKGQLVINGEAKSKRRNSSVGDNSLSLLKQKKSSTPIASPKKELFVKESPEIKLPAESVANNITPVSISSTGNNTKSEIDDDFEILDSDNDSISETSRNEPKKMTREERKIQQYVHLIQMNEKRDARKKDAKCKRSVRVNSGEEHNFDDLSMPKSKDISTRGRRKKRGSGRNSLRKNSNSSVDHSADGATTDDYTTNSTPVTPASADPLTKVWVSRRKHIMNNWIMDEEYKSTVEATSGPSGAEEEALKLDRVRRQSSPVFIPNSESYTAVGPTKKRWLKQAMNESCSSPGSDHIFPDSQPSSPLPNQKNIERVTPLKKRRVTLESLQSNNQKLSLMSPKKDENDDITSNLNNTKEITTINDKESMNDQIDNDNTSEDMESSRELNLKGSPLHVNVNDDHLNFLTSNFGGGCGSPATPTMDEQEELVSPNCKTLNQSPNFDSIQSVPMVNYSSEKPEKKSAIRERSLSKGDGKKTLSLETYKARKKQQGITITTSPTSTNVAYKNFSSNISSVSPPILSNVLDKQLELLPPALIPPPPPPPPKNKSMEHLCDIGTAQVSEKFPNNLESVTASLETEENQLSLSERLKKCFGVDVEAEDDDNSQAMSNRIKSRESRLSSEDSHQNLTYDQFSQRNSLQNKQHERYRETHNYNRRSQSFSRFSGSYRHSRLNYPRIGQQRSSRYQSHQAHNQYNPQNQHHRNYNQPELNRTSSPYSSSHSRSFAQRVRTDR